MKNIMTEPELVSRPGCQLCGNPEGETLLQVVDDEFRIFGYFADGAPEGVEDETSPTG